MRTKIRIKKNCNDGLDFIATSNFFGGWQVKDGRRIITLIDSNADFEYLEKNYAGWKYQPKAFEGDVMFSMNVGEEVWIDNQFKPWTLKKSKKGFFFEHPTIGFSYIGWKPEGKEYLLATTSGSARRGIIHQVRI